MSTRALGIALFLAAVPGLLGSLLIMPLGGAGGGLLTLQLTVSLVSMALYGLCAWRAARPLRAQTAAWMLGGMALLLFLPLVLSRTAPPDRWIPLGGFRLYLAAVLLPASPLLLRAALRAPGRGAVGTWLAVAAVAVALAMQPDASQLSAFSAACVLPISASRRPTGEKVALAVWCAACTLVAWWRPDPLLPVSYVEGVMSLAAGQGALGAGAAILACVTVPLVLVGLARAAKMPGLTAVAVYYGVISALAWLQLTPMPLLGFGVGPIVGYFAMACLATRVDLDGPG